jgi:hypothetical protein
MSFNEAEELRQSGNAKSADEKFAEASSMSELAENYSTVYAAFYEYRESLAEIPNAREFAGVVVLFCCVNNTLPDRPVNI